MEKSVATIDDSEGTSASGGKAPIFAEDMPCPRCEYNLRGIAEARCPECGEAFDPQDVIKYSRRRQLNPPRWWIIRNVLRHPMSVWSSPEVLHGQGATLGQQVAFPAMGLVLPVVLPSLFAGSRERSDALGVALLVWTFGIGVTMAIILLHRTLCWIVLRVCGRQKLSEDAGIVIGYATVWLTAALPCAIVGSGMATDIMTRRAYTGFFPVPGLAAYVGVALCGASLLCSAGLWAMTLYVGMRSAVGTGRLLAAWCALANPLLWLFGGVELQVLVVFTRT